MVVLIGFMGAGKSTVGRIVADRSGVPFVDSDVLIERRAGQTIRAMFDEHGEAYFRALERRTVVELLNDDATVLALGGGAALDPVVGELLRSHTVVYLEVPYDQALARVQGDGYRPLLRTAGVRELYDRRLPAYEALATIRIQTAGRRPDDIAVDILRMLAPAADLPRVSSSLVTTVGGTYFAHAGVGVTASVGTLVRASVRAENVVLIAADEDRALGDDIAAQFADADVVRIGVADREPSKSFDTLARIAEQMATRAVHRKDVVVGVGGEVVGDIAGLVAALWGRGMPLALVPTTLVAQADSAIGGKNAISLPQGRNLIGTIHQPVVVVADTAVSRVAGRRGYAAGLAEIAKHALLDGPDAAARLLDQAPALRGHDAAAVDEAVRFSQAYKAGVVSRDERETGDRAFLNYGHTFAHALELALDLDGSDDGMPVAVGMMAAAHLAHVQGTLSADDVDLHRRLLGALGLPVQAQVDIDRLESAWVHDKKYDHGARFVLLDGIGRPGRDRTATHAELATALEALAAG